MLSDCLERGFLVVMQRQHGGRGASPVVAVGYSRLMVHQCEHNHCAPVHLAQLVADFVFQKPDNFIQEGGAFALAANVTAEGTVPSPPPKPQLDSGDIVRVDGDWRAPDRVAHEIAEFAGHECVGLTGTRIAGDCLNDGFDSRE